MLDLLGASRKNGPRAGPWVGGLVSMGVHALVLMAFAHPGADRDQLPEPDIVDSIIIFPAPRADREPTRSPVRPAMPILPVPVDDRLPIGPLTSIYGDLPGMNLAPVFDPRASLGRQSREAMWRGLVGTAGSDDATFIFSPSLVDEPPAPLSCPEPIFPRALRAARIEGDVVAELVIDREGRVDPATITIVESSHEEFRRAVIAMYHDARCVFRPGLVAGQRVSVLVRQSVAFRIR